MPSRRRAIAHLAPLGLLAFLGCASQSGSGSTEMRRIILAQVARHPQMEPRDLYKLLDQAAMGSEHVMGDSVGVRLWMEREVETMTAGPVEPMVDTIAPGGRVVLIHLRPWVAAGRSTDSLLSAFMLTAALIPRDTVLLVSYLALADTMAAEGVLPFGAIAWGDLVTGMSRGGYPAIHHSDTFEHAYRPAYRVVAGSLVP